MDTIFTFIAAAWLILQALALWKLRGKWRVAAWIPFAGICVAFAVAVLGGLAGSNIAPIWVVFTLPLALLWIMILWLLRGIAWGLSR